MKVCVQGLWHLGTVTAAGLASVGHEVAGLDYSGDLVASLGQGIPPLFEPRLEALLQEGIAEKRLKFTSNPADAVRGIGILWVAYDTPVDEDDNADVDFVVAQIEKTLHHLPIGTTVLISSQMPVGTVRRLEQIAASSFSGKDIRFAYSPENLRLGKALDVFLKPDRVVVGVRTPEDRERIERLLRPITDRIEWMSVESAEMTKHAINAFLATSVTFTNEIAALCELVGADAKEIERGLKTESRIGPKAYVSPGAAFAGGTLARDIAFLNDIGARHHLTTPLLSSVKPSNDEHKRWVMRKLQALFPDLSQATVAVWGLTYKPGTDTLRRSMAAELCDWLSTRSVQVRVHDPAVKMLPPHWGANVTRFDTALAALESANALVISTEWPEYRSISAEDIVATAPRLAIVDANRFVSHVAGTPGLTYVAVGSPQRKSDR